MLAYLSTSDYVQHKNRPEEPGALTFYEAVDEVIGRLDALGITVALTADHGMNDKVGSMHVVTAPRSPPYPRLVRVGSMNSMLGVKLK